MAAGSYLLRTAFRGSGAGPAAMCRSCWPSVTQSLFSFPHTDRPVLAETISELAAKIKNPHQKKQISGAALQETVTRYNSFVTTGADTDFKKPTPLHKIDA